MFMIEKEFSQEGVPHDKRSLSQDIVAWSSWRRSYDTSGSNWADKSVQVTPTKTHQKTMQNFICSSIYRRADPLAKLGNRNS